jgi:hypothetical protein
VNIWNLSVLSPWALWWTLWRHSAVCKHKNLKTRRAKERSGGLCMHNLYKYRPYPKKRTRSVSAPPRRLCTTRLLQCPNDAIQTLHNFQSGTESHFITGCHHAYPFFPLSCISIHHYGIKNCFSKSLNSLCRAYLSPMAVRS